MTGKGHSRDLSIHMCTCVCILRSLWDGDAEEEPHEQIGQVVIRLELETLVLIRQLEGHDGGWSVQVNPNKPSKNW